LSGLRMLRCCRVLRGFVGSCWVWLRVIF